MRETARRRRAAMTAVLGLTFLASASFGAGPASRPAGRPGQVWRGVHILSPGKAGLPLLERAITEVFAPIGVNVLVLEVGYQYEFASHPELRQDGAISKADARRIAELCRKHSIRVIPELDCLGHQSWAKSVWPLLTKYPDMEEPPSQAKDAPRFYCRSWCPLHPKVNEIVFALVDELIDGFGADAFHVGMDEVFVIASEQCPRCKGRNPAELYAKAVNDLHGHLVKEKKVTMLMWGDRLLDAKTMKYGEWEASVNGTAPAIDMIPKDIIICDWHYGARDDYPSIRYFQEKGFRVWPSPWHDLKAAEALLACSQRGATDKMIGLLCTTWMSDPAMLRAILGEGDSSKLPKNAVEAAATLRACMGKSAR
jgi:hypothetical protein